MEHLSNSQWHLVWGKYQELCRWEIYNFLTRFSSRETFISLGQLDNEGCSTTLSSGTLSVHGSTGEFLFSAFLHNGRYFLDTLFYFGRGILEERRRGDNSVFAVADYQHDNKAELWHCRLGHVNLPDVWRLQTSALVCTSLPGNSYHSASPAFWQC